MRRPRSTDDRYLLDQFSHSELRAWQAAEEALTEYRVQQHFFLEGQVFGGLLMDAGFEAVLYPSSKGPGRCLAVFTRNLSGSESVVELKGQPPAGVKHRKLNQDTSRNSEEWT